MKEKVKNIIMILEDVKASYYNDAFIQERLAVAIQNLKTICKQLKSK